jgi:hypothetical protein
MSQVRSVLTPEQQTKLDQMKQHQGHGRGMGQGQGMGPKREGQQQGPPPKI